MGGIARTGPRDRNRFSLDRVNRSFARIRCALAGMTCASCVTHIENAIKAVPGVNAATVNLATERVSVHHLADIASLEDLEAAIRSAGYEPHRIEAGDARIP